MENKKNWCYGNQKRPFISKIKKRKNKTNFNVINKMKKEKVS